MLSTVLLIPQGVMAQTTNEQLLEVIKKLEARVAELEGKVAKQEIQETTGAPRAESCGRACPTKWFGAWLFNVKPAVKRIAVRWQRSIFTSASADRESVGI